MLKHHADPGAQRRQAGFGIAYGDAIDNDFPGLERLEPVDTLDQR
ncbi:hypothetical protein SDC9_169342 [bioreactor metagenome]|uniref:Uncharacterized protein n=1 Tax=bioreactor metagenome TaxID=1076179 RepID=A0A645G7J9_9ZZZZ